MNDFKEKQSLPFPVIKDDESYLIVRYEEDGKLYLIQNTKNITCGFDDYLVATYTKTNELDTHLPYSVCQVVASFNQYSLEIAEFLEVNLFEQEINYFGEDAVLNITNPDGGNGGFTVIIPGEVNPDEEGTSGEEDSLEDIMAKKPNQVPKPPQPAKEYLDKKGDAFMFRKFIRK